MQMFATLPSIAPAAIPGREGSRDNATLVDSTRQGPTIDDRSTRRFENEFEDQIRSRDARRPLDELREDDQESDSLREEEVDSTPILACCFTNAPPDLSTVSTTTDSETDVMDAIDGEQTLESPRSAVPTSRDDSSIVSVATKTESESPLGIVDPSNLGETPTDDASSVAQVESTTGETMSSPESVETKSALDSLQEHMSSTTPPASERNDSLHPKSAMDLNSTDMLGSDPIPDRFASTDVVVDESSHTAPPNGTLLPADVAIQATSRPSDFDRDIEQEGEDEVSESLGLETEQESIDTSKLSSPESTSRTPSVSPEGINQVSPVVATALSSADGALIRMYSADAATRSSSERTTDAISSVDVRSHGNDSPIQTSAISNSKSAPRLSESLPIEQQVVDHVVSARHSMKDGEITLEVQLDPPDLGGISIELTEQDETVSARILVAEPMTLDALRRAMPLIVDSLSQAGLSLHDFQLSSSPYGNGEQGDGGRQRGHWGTGTNADSDLTPAFLGRIAWSSSGKVNILA